MKSVLLPVLVAASLCICIASCDGSSDSPAQQGDSNSPLVGIWRHAHDTTIITTPLRTAEYYRFSTGGSMEYKRYTVYGVTLDSLIETGTWSLADDSMVIVHTYLGETRRTAHHYALQGGKLLITFHGENSSTVFSYDRVEAIVPLKAN